MATVYLDLEDGRVLVYEGPAAQDVHLTLTAIANLPSNKLSKKGYQSILDIVKSVERGETPWPVTCWEGCSERDKKKLPRLTNFRLVPKESKDE